MARVVIGLLVVGLVLVGCGSGGEAPEVTGTEMSERVARQATVLQEEEAEESVEPAEKQDEPAEESEDSGDQEVVELPAEIVGEHKGVRSERNVLGEPDAPVEIRYYGDFT